VFLIAGLGNPGDKYIQTRHNIGFIFLDYLADRHGLVFSDSKWQAKTGRVRLWGEQLIFVEPETFMNNSGMAVGQIAAYFKIPPENILVIHDELDLPPGRVKMVCSRGSGGHNGISSIISHVGSKDFVRIRIGIGRPDSSAMKVSSYVLGKLGGQEKHDIEKLYGDIERGLEIFVEQGSQAAMNFLNSVS
jgi:PTH1 family peptidyl-tRNA hydrolase